MVTGTHAGGITGGGGDGGGWAGSGGLGRVGEWWWQRRVCSSRLLCRMTHTNLRALAASQAAGIDDCHAATQVQAT